MKGTRGALVNALQFCCVCFFVFNLSKHTLDCTQHLVWLSHCSVLFFTNTCSMQSLYVFPKRKEDWCYVHKQCGVQTLRMNYPFIKNHNLWICSVTYELSFIYLLFCSVGLIVQVVFAIHSLKLFHWALYFIHRTYFKVLYIMSLNLAIWYSLWFKN